MATLTTAVVNAGYPNSGTPPSTPRGAVKFLSNVYPQSSLSSGTESVLKVMTQSTLLNGDTSARASKVVLGSVNEVAVGYVKFFSNVSTISYSPEVSVRVTAANTNLTANSINSITITSVSEKPLSIMQYANIDKTISTRLTSIITSVSEEPIFSIPFFNKEIAITSVSEKPVSVMDKNNFNITLGTRDSKVITTPSEAPVVAVNWNNSYSSLHSFIQTSVSEKPVSVMDKNTFNITLGTRDSLTITSVSEEPIFTTKFYSNVANNVIGNSIPLAVMTTSTFNQTLGTRSSLTINTPSEKPVAVLNWNNSYSSLNSSAQLVVSEEPVAIVDRNNLTIQSKQGSAIQPKGTEAGNIGFAQAFGNTAITGKWF